MIEGLSHITLITRNLDRMSTIVETVLEGRELYASGEATFSIAREKFYDVGGVWVAVMEGEPLPTRTYNHVAFKIGEGDFDACRRRIESLGLDLRESRPRVEGEGRSLYFYDDDNHLFELHTGTLEERLRRYRQGEPQRLPAPRENGGAAIGRTRAEALSSLRKAFAQAGIQSAALDARVLLTAALGIDNAALVADPDAALREEEAARLSGFARRRLNREPVARILGEREFWGLPFALSPETLVPRPDTETVVATSLAWIRDRTAPMTILDLGTGSGCLLVALLHECPAAFGIGIDRSPGALATARRNAARNRVGHRAAFAAADWAAALRGRFDLIVSNPPYIRSEVIPGLDPDVKAHDPRLALDGGADGLDAYRTILREAEPLLAQDGLLALEIGFDQEEDLRHLASGAGLEVWRVAPDLSGHPRCIALKRTRS